MAELIKIAIVGNSGIFELLEKYGEDLLPTRFGHLDGTPELREIAAPGHLRRHRHDARAGGAQPARARPGPGDRLRPHLEPDARADARDPVLPRPRDQHRHGVLDHASPSSAATSRPATATAIFWLMSRLGLALDSPYLTPELLRKATDSIVQTRDGLLRAAVPRPDRDLRLRQRPRPTDELGRGARRPPGGVPRLPARRRRRGHVHADDRAAATVPAPGVADAPVTPGRRSWPAGSTALAAPSSDAARRASTRRSRAGLRRGAASCAAGLDPYLEPVHDAGVAGAARAGRSAPRPRTGRHGTTAPRPRWSRRCCPVTSRASC